MLSSYIVECVFPNGCFSTWGPSIIYPAFTQKLTTQLSLKTYPVAGGTFQSPCNYWGVWLYAKHCWLSECTPHFKNWPQKWSERRNAIRTANKLVEINVCHTLKQIKEKLKVPKKVLSCGRLPVHSNQADLNKIPRTLTCALNANHADYHLSTQVNHLVTKATGNVGGRQALLSSQELLVPRKNKSAQSSSRDD